MWIIKHRTLFYAFSVVLLAVSLGAIFIFPKMHLGIDFTGGSLVELSYETRPELADVQKTVNDFASSRSVSVASIQPSGDNAYVIRTSELQEADKQALLNALNTFGTSTVERFNSLGPTVGSELGQKALLAIAVVVLAIVLFITFAFRHVSEPVSSWKYGVATIVALVHDVIIPAGAYVIYNHYVGGEVDMLFVSALLAILGFSVHDTIVVFDRIRENLRVNKVKGTLETFEITVGRSVEQTFTRSINTSVTTIIVLVALYFFGSSTTQPFTFALIAGMVIGTYSSIFIASPLMVTFFNLFGGAGRKNK